MSRFYPGNVIMTKDGSIEVVYDVRPDGYTSTIFIGHSNSQAGHREKTYQEEISCDCGGSDCEYCNGTKKNIVTYYGMEDAKLIARTIKEWITKSLTKNFGF